MLPVLLAHHRHLRLRCFARERVSLFCYPLTGYSPYHLTGFVVFLPYLEYVLRHFVPSSLEKRAVLPFAPTCSQDAQHSKLSRKVQAGIETKQSSFYYFNPISTPLKCIITHRKSMLTAPPSSPQCQHDNSYSFCTFVSGSGCSSGAWLA
jgi:hypothetical protein